LRRGFTLVELLIVVIVVGLVSAAVGRAYVAGIDYNARANQARQTADEHGAVRRQLAALLRHAYLSPNPDEAASFFISTTGEAGMASDLVFSASGRPLPPQALDADGTFEELNERFGTLGGVEEIALSLQPFANVGDASGVFLRRQQPADGDPGQGGFEELLLPNVVELGFEFFDGAAWQASWDTQGMEPARLPAAVRVHYRLERDAEAQTFVVRLINSDATADDPVPAGGGVIG
jgi:prepilin-type N-terminal cleavage/methylation domain-containing protein